MPQLMLAGNLIIHVIFDTYIVILLLRFILQKCGASWRNPLSQFIIQLTEKPLFFFRKLVPGYRGFDLSILLFAVILQLIENILWVLILGMSPHILGILLISLSNLLSKFVYIYLYAIIINAIVSWIPSLQSHPVAHIVFIISEPLLSKIRRVIPLIAGIDISPMIAILVLTIINILITQPIFQIGMKYILGAVQ